MFDDVAPLTASLVQKHNLGQHAAIKAIQKERRKEHKEQIIRKNMGRLKKLVEDQF